MTSQWIDAAALREQTAHAEEVFDAYMAYAKRIGCTTFQDEVICNDEQAKALEAWWSAHAMGNGREQ
jgi:hypothetical protein